MNELKCPVCQGTDCVAYVQDVINNETNTTVTNGRVYDWSSSSPVGFSTSVYTTSQQSRLAKSLLPPDKPGASGEHWAFYFLVSWVVGAVYSLMKFSSMNFLSLFFIAICGTCLLGAVVASVISICENIYRIPAKIDWTKRANKLSMAKYCYHDDIVFEGTIYAKPDVFVYHTFAD